ncbi:hypothetical protein ABDK56_05170 [Sphingomonas sp. ASV193]|uniref:hypothetical protein n=1 Tax=Sphingomonas sp. ASV193 TaxID=3144405 RepID=UPI0032E857B8
MNRTILLGAALGALGAIAASPALADPGHGHGWGNQRAQGYGVGGCPPGLAKKNNGCLPPGQAKKRYNVGQRYYGSRLMGYNQLPDYYQQRYAYDPYARYAYDNGYYYQVDPRTQLISRVLGALIR